MSDFDRDDVADDCASVNIYGANTITEHHARVDSKVVRNGDLDDAVDWNAALWEEDEWEDRVPA